MLTHKNHLLRFILLKEEVLVPVPHSCLSNVAVRCCSVICSQFHTYQIQKALAAPKSSLDQAASIQSGNNSHFQTHRPDVYAAARYPNIYISTSMSHGENRINSLWVDIIRRTTTCKLLEKFRRSPHAPLAPQRS